MSQWLALGLATPFSNSLQLKQIQFSPADKQDQNERFVDAFGYLGLTLHRPNYQLPPLKGSIDTLWKIANMNEEGLASLWKGFMFLS